MPLGLERRHNLGHLHFITFSCHHRLPYLETPKPKEILEQVIERTRITHTFLLYAYVLMPEHLHLLVSEPKTHSLSSTIRVIKGESSKLLKGKRNHLWQPRYYDFNVFTTRAFFAIFAVALVCSFTSGCGSPPPLLTLSVQPGSAFLRSTSEINEFIQLRAVLSDGQSALQTNWTTSDACVAVNTQGLAGCNVTCAGTRSSTITASAQGLIAQASITCQYN